MVYGLSLFVIFISLLSHLKSHDEVLVRRLTIGSRAVYPLAIAVTAALVAYFFAL